MLKELTKVLLIEDNIGDQVYCKEMLVEAGYSLSNITAISTLDEYNSWVEKIVFDVILLDLFLLDSSGMQTIDFVMSTSSKSAIIILSGITDERLAVYAVKSGAQDFLIKDEYDAKLLDKTITYGIERLNYTAMLEDSKRQYQELFQLNPIPIILVDEMDMSIRMVNHAAKLMFEKDVEGIQNQALSTMLGAHASDVLRNEEKKNFEISFDLGLAKKRVIVKVHKNAIKFHDHNYLLLMFEDITERVEFDKRISELCSNVQSFERKSIAMELHDGIAQELTLVNLYLNQIETQYQNDLVRNCKHILNDTINQVRTLSYSIIPPLIDQGFLNALESYFQRISKVKNIVFENKLQSNEINFSYERNYNLFRLIQEFVNNSIKHADSEIIGCALEESNEQIKLFLFDDGKGFDMNDKENKRGMGLSSMQDRAAVNNFGFHLSSEPNRGTTLEIIVDKHR